MKEFDEMNAQLKNHCDQLNDKFQNQLSEIDFKYQNSLLEIQNTIDKMKKDVEDSDSEDDSSMLSNLSSEKLTKSNKSIQQQAIANLNMQANDNSNRRKTMVNFSPF